MAIPKAPDRAAEWTPEMEQVTYLDTFAAMAQTAGSAADLAAAASAESQKNIDAINLENEALKAEAEAAKAEAEAAKEQALADKAEAAAAQAAADEERERLELERLELEQNGN